jgi:glycosyltransferase involved in cell wall biosynthesis
MVVFPGIDLKMFYPKEKIEKKKIIIGTIGRTQDFKGTSYVLEAFEKLRKIYGEKIELHMAFGLEEWNELDGVFVEIPENDKELAMYYQKIDMYICAGTIQLGAVHCPVLESFATKTPLITTGYYPSSEQNSLIVPIKDSDAIVNAVKLIIENPELMDEKVLKGYEDVKEFSFDRTSQKMLSYFKN